MKLREDHRDAGEPPGDKSFKDLKGSDYGLTVWIPEGEEKGKGKIDRMVEIHFVFPDAATAEKYLHDNVAQLAERLPQVKNAPKVGDQSLIVGGLQSSPVYGYAILQLHLALSGRSHADQIVCLPGRSGPQIAAIGRCPDCQEDRRSRGPASGEKTRNTTSH